MSEYIEREVALNLIDRYWQQAYNAHFLDAAVRLGSVYREIEELPAADVRPVVRGKWTKELHPNVRYNQYKCSICGEFSGHDSEGWIWKPNFCPNCGADMREES